VAEAVQLAEDICRAVAGTVFLAEPSPDVPALRISGQITASIGVACLRAHVSSNARGELIRAADQAMYAAKHAGRGRVVTARRQPVRKELSQ
jgi:diguanylate cyclase (GGDEF)-like protein